MPIECPLLVAVTSGMPKVSTRSGSRARMRKATKCLLGLVSLSGTPVGGMLCPVTGLKQCRVRAPILLGAMLLMIISAVPPGMH